jgi:hypothetical protein
VTDRSKPSFDPDHLRPPRFLDSDHPSVAEFARKTTQGAGSDAERAVRLFYVVRDRIRYDPYTSNLEPETFKASVTLGRDATFCVPKAILLAAGARAVGIPSRLGFADVRNHLATARLLRILRTDLSCDLSLCERFAVKPLEFNGRDDALLHPFDHEGKRHMEYVHDRGSHADLPLDEMARALREAYPHLFDGHGRLVPFSRTVGDFENEAAREKREGR